MDRFVGELRMFAFDFAPRGWAICDGQILPISDNEDLYSLLGTTYGGDGRTTFGLPDLRGRALLHRNRTFAPGDRTGAETVQLSLDNVPAHGHVLNAASNTRANSSAGGGSFAEPMSNVGAIYAPAATSTALRPESVSCVGGVAHQNMQPFLTLNWAISLHGIVPRGTGDPVQPERQTGTHV